MTIGEKLKLRRLKAGFTQEQIAAKMNIARQTLSNWEVGKNMPDIDSIIVLARIYNLSLDELLLSKIFFKGVLTMFPKRTKDEIHAMIRSQFPEAADLKELTGGLASQTFSFDVKGQRCVFKTGTRMEVHEKEQWVYNKYHQLLPLRRMIGNSETSQQQPYAVFEYIEGVKVFDLSSKELFDVMASILELLATLQSVDVSDVDGYGRFDETGKASYLTWNDFIEAIDNESIYDWSRLDLKKIDAEVIDAAIHKLKQGAPHIKISKKQLIHGDLGSFNLIADRGRITGLIDWSLSMYGDHLYDIANFMFWNEDKLQPLIAHLSVQYMNTAEDRRTISCYMLRIGLEELYNTLIMNEAGYDVEWVANRLQTITDGSEI
ncbi:phosphotransferase [Paenibacillus rhizovicinus]|uniref:Phosphotransferase n=1 Tax=Paenibacillus rhizovicinus TaxID=2704463 RepID=A0A6C0NZ93_9BACL|nr:phosphotransferase [Paenibacillus rhizovicinus]QHW29792.1 phosphotransferase [Paenibacillus rhizovicinus]